MVLGLFEGKVIIDIRKTSFLPGQTIRGRAMLYLNKPTPARALRLDIYRTGYRASGREGTSLSKIIFFSKKISGKKTYKDGEIYKFEVPAPADTSLSSVSANTLPDALSSMFASALPPSYYLSVSLDLPMKFDIGNSVHIQILSPR